MEDDTTTYPSISTPCEERTLDDFSHLFKTPPKKDTELTASPPLFSNIVLKTFHNAGIDLDVLFNILPIIKISPEEIEKSTTIDYNNMFISVRKFPKSRGYRKPSKIKSFLDMDFYFLDRKFHMKVSTNKLTIVGGGNKEISRKLLETVYEYWKNLNDTWNSFNDMKRENVNSVSEAFIKKTPPEDPKELEFYNFLEVIIDREQEDVMERLRSINPYIGKPLYTNSLQVGELINCNSVYNYRLPDQISLAEKAEVLYKKGYQVILHNSVIVKCLKAIWVDPDSKNKFSFSIQNIGTIKQNSSNTHEDSEKMYEKIVRDLGYQPYKQGCEFAKKTKPKAPEVVTKNDNCIKILDKYMTALES